MSARAGLHAVAAGVLVPFGVAAGAIGLLRLAGLVAGVAGDITAAVSPGTGLVPALFAIGVGVTWLGLHEARRCFAIIQATREP